MEKILELIKQSPAVIIIVAIGYFGKLYIENEINAIHTKINEIGKTSLNIKQDLRDEERQALIDFRIAVEHWENFLLSSLANFSNSQISVDSINEYYNQENTLQLDVKVAIAKLGVIAQNEDIYQNTLNILINISRIHNPFINKYLPMLIDMQAQYEPIKYRMKKYEESLSGKADFKYSLEQAKADKALSQSINVQKTQLIQQYSDELLGVYPKLVEQLVELKVSMNQQAYRPILSDRIDMD